MKYVYFIQEGHDGPIKIGVSGNPRNRMSEMQTGNSRRLRMLACIMGGFETEKWIHRLFGIHRLSGEWFNPCQEILEYIEIAHSHGYAEAA